VDLHSRFGTQLIFIVIIVLLSLTAAFFVRRRPAWFFGLDPAASCLAIGSALAIAVATLSRQGGGAHFKGKIQLIPLHTLRSYRNLPDLLVYLGGNVVLFVPLGFCLYLALRRREAGPTSNPTLIRVVTGVLLSAALSALASVTVEILQIPIYTRSTDVDDVLTNGFGGLLGALAGAVALFFLQAWATGSPPPSPPTRVALPRQSEPPVWLQGPDDPARDYAVGSRAS
jgi:glycopeptide antibiotics resistance protein